MTAKTRIMASGENVWPLLAGLRFALALSVVTCHVSILGPVVHPTRLLWTFGGFTAVIGFFLISGYSIAHSVQSRPEGFARRRLERILPLFLAAAVFGLLPVILLGGVISLPGSEAVTTPSPWQYAATLLLLNGIVCATPFLLHPLWSLSCEAAYYFLAPVLRRLTLQPLVALILASAFLYIRHSPRSFPDETHGTAAYCLLWAWLTGFVFYRLPKNGHRPLRAALILLGVGLLCCSGAEEGKLTLATFLAVALTLWFGSECRIPDRAARVLTFLGDLSYPLYLTHLTVLIFLAHTRVIHWGAVAVPFCWLCALAVAAIFYGGIELPARRLLRGRKSLPAPIPGSRIRKANSFCLWCGSFLPAPQNWGGGAFMFRILPPLLLMLAALIFARGVILFWPYSVDDGFITFRYARNLMSGGGPNFNPGQHAEGCTCALWMLLMTIPAFLHVSAEMTAKVAGVALTMGAGALAYLTARRMIGHDDWIGRCSAASVPLLMALLYETEANATNAMETSFFSMAVILCLYLSVRVVQEPSPRLMKIWGVSALVIGLTRPDGNILVIVSLALMVLLLPPAPRRNLLKIALLAYALPGALYMAARWQYYGLPLPLPFYLKVTGRHNSGAAFGGGVAYVAGYLTKIMTAVGVLLALSLRRFPRAALPAAAACATLLAFYLRVDPIMGQDYRFLVPTAPFLFAAAGLGLDGLMRVTASALRQTPSESPHLRQIASFALPCLIGAMFLFLGAAPPLCSGINATAAQRRAWQVGALAVHTHLGHVLHEIDPTGQSVLAMGDCGMCPYYSGWRTIDIFGLNDPQIARTGRIEPGYVSRQNPDVVVLVSSSGGVAHWDCERTLSVYNDCVVYGQYRRCAILCSDPGTHYLWVYAKPGTKAFEAITKLFQELAHSGLGPYHFQS